MARRLSSWTLLISLSVLVVLMVIVVLAPAQLPWSRASAPPRVLAHVFVDCDDDDLGCLCGLESVLHTRSSSIPVYVWSPKKLLNQNAALLAHIYDKKGRSVFLQPDIRSVWDVLFEQGGVVFSATKRTAPRCSVGRTDHDFGFSK